ncbi:hypothetical protein CJ030_MR4G021303 [Morella rubra]|uniref:Uncharacterized protein n=1 Tax=Morella rubra TaxID=262757 RepID=A0A6A1VZN5_9ROSI|nr:hypothetical protein CJ030_MR4G021303 [Morella rubra]
MDKKAVKRFGVQMMLVLVLIILVQVPAQADDNPFFSLVSPNLAPYFPPFPLPSPNYIPAAPRHDATGAEAIAQKECREECEDKLHPCDIEKLGALKFWLEKCIEDCLKPYAINKLLLSSLSDDNFDDYF